MKNLNKNCDDLKEIKKIKPNMIIPIITSMIGVTPSIIFVIYMIETKANEKLLLLTLLNFPCIILMIISWVIYWSSKENYKEIIKKYHTEIEKIKEE